MDIKNILNKIRATNMSHDDQMHGEVAVGLAKIKKELNEAGDSNKYVFILNDINPDLKALKTITAKLHEFDIKLGKPEEDVDANLNWMSCVDITITKTNTDITSFKYQLNNALDDYLQELGVSLRCSELKKLTPSYQNIIGNDLVKENSNDKKMRI